MCENKCNKKSKATMTIENCIYILKNCTLKIKVCNHCGKKKPNKEETNIECVIRELQKLDNELLMQMEG